MSPGESRSSISMLRGGAGSASDTDLLLLALSAEQSSPPARCRQTPNKISLNFPGSVASRAQETALIIPNGGFLTPVVAKPQPGGGVCTHSY